MYLLFGTAGCHLCEETLEMLAEVRKFLPVTVREVDIAEESHWQSAYAVTIPVILHQASGRELAWPFTQNELHNFIQELSDEPTVSN